MPEMQVWFLCLEDPLEKEMSAHSSILAWEIPWTEEPDGLQSMGSQRVRRDLATKTTATLLRSVCVVQFLGFTTEHSRAWRLEDAWIYHSAKILSSYLCEILKERSWFRMAETRDKEPRQRLRAPSPTSWTLRRPQAIDSFHPTRNSASILPFQ